MRRRVGELFAIEHPAVPGGMATATAPELVAAVFSVGVDAIEPAGAVVERSVREAGAIRARLARVGG